MVREENRVLADEIADLELLILRKKAQLADLKENLKEKLEALDKSEAPEEQPPLEEYEEKEASQ